MSKYFDRGLLIDKFPTEVGEDVVKVVRCKECKYSRELCFAEIQLYGESHIGCMKLSSHYHTLFFNKNDYCACAERKMSSDNK